MANKQYIYKLAYTDNYHVIQVVDGKIEHSTIVAYYELDGFLSALRSMGYEEGYYVPEYKLEMLKAQEELEFAQKAYNRAVQHPVNFASGEVEMYKMITHMN